VGVMMMRLVMNAMMVVTLMVFIATAWVPRRTGLCRRKRSGENDRSECNFQVHDVSFPLICSVLYLNSGQTKRCPTTVARAAERRDDREPH
jgi:hypothetical protein